MKRSLLAACALPFVVALPASADCAVLQPLAFVPFDGLELPTNAELRLVAPFQRQLLLTPAGGEPRTVDIVEDDIGQLVELPADLDPLPTGAYAFQLLFDGTFTMGTVVDDEAPIAPVVTVAYVPDPRLPLLRSSECGASGSNHRTAFTVERTSRGDVILVDGRAVAAGTDGTTTFDIPAFEGEADVVIRDLAGNESPATTIVATMGCGCSTSSAMDVVGVLALLGLLRRRRR